jgi:glycosyltransferase involved in cell wall biosynthesis
LTAAGHEVFLLCQLDSPLARWAADAPFQVNSDFNLNHYGPTKSLRAFTFIRKLLRTFQPDILNPHCPPGHSFLALAAALEHNRASLTRTIADPRSPNRNAINHRLHLNHTKGLIFSSREMQRRYAAVFPQSTIPAEVVSPGFRADDFTSSTISGGFRKRYGLRDDQILAGIVARLSPVKGHNVFLQALALMPTGIRDRIFCICAGENTRERSADDLMALATELGVENNVAFSGILDKVQPLMTELDVGLVTSLGSEAVCRVALEYMSFGVPVIASDVNILPDIVKHGENGWLYPHDSARTLAECLTECVIDAEKRKAMGICGAQNVRNELSLSAEVSRVIAFYEKIRSNHGDHNA